jgi:hypothetical protein
VVRPLCSGLRTVVSAMLATDADGRSNIVACCCVLVTARRRRDVHQQVAGSAVGRSVGHSATYCGRHQP